MTEVEVGWREKRSERGEGRGSGAVVKEVGRALLAWRKEGFQREVRPREPNSQGGSGVKSNQ